jgi:hypothetical protein
MSWYGAQFEFFLFKYREIKMDLHHKYSNFNICRNKITVSIYSLFSYYNFLAKNISFSVAMLLLA